MVVNVYGHVGHFVMPANAAKFKRRVKTPMAWRTKRMRTVVRHAERSNRGR